MTISLLWDAAPGEIRTGLIENDKVTELRILRRDSGKAPYQPGQHFTARLLEKPNHGKALVTVGHDIKAILQPAPKLNEGALIAVEMTRAPIPEPGRWKLPIVRPAPKSEPTQEPQWHVSAEPWVQFLRSSTVLVDEIICPDVRVLTEIKGAVPNKNMSLRINAEAFSKTDLDSLIDAAILGEFPVVGGMLSIERTRAMTMIDVDGGGDPLPLNLAAAREIPRLLRLYDIGGQIGIDFLALPSRKERQIVDKALAATCSILGLHKCTTLNGFGFAQIVRPRPGPSVPEILCGITPGRASSESHAIALLRDAQRSQGYGPRILTTKPSIANVLQQWPEHLASLERSLGVAIEIVADPNTPGYGHVYVSQS